MQKVNLYVKAGITIGCAMCLLLSGLTVHGENKRVIPFNKSDTDEHRYWEFWVIPERDIIFKPDKVVKLAGIGPGDTVADIGAGAGYFTFHFARAVGPDGMVYALDKKLPRDLEEYFDEQIMSEEKNPYQNVRLINNVKYDAGLPPETIDVAFMCLDAILLMSPRDIVFPFQKEGYDNQNRMMASVYDALKPGGKLVLVDLIYNPEFSNPQNDPEGSVFDIFLMARDMEAVKDNYERLGFRFVEEYDLYRDEQHRKDVEYFKTLPVYQTFGTFQNFFQLQDMFIYVFEKPLDQKGVR